MDLQLRHYIMPFVRPTTWVYETPSAYECECILRAFTNHYENDLRTVFQGTYDRLRTTYDLLLAGF